MRIVTAALLIAVTAQAVAGQTTRPAAATTAPAAAKSSVAKGDRKPHEPPKAGETREMNIKDLGNFAYDPDENTPIPDDVKALSGMTVRLHGYMIPLDQAEDITRFALVPTLTNNCCHFGGPPQLQHTILVTCPKGKAVAYFADEITVEGKITVETVKDDGFIVGIFSLDAASVKSATK